MDKYEMLSGYLRSVEQVMSDLFQSGFDTIHDSTARSLGEIAAEAGQYQMNFLQGQLKRLEEELLLQRHRMSRSYETAAEAYERVVRYISICMERLELDRAGASYGRERGDRDEKA